MQGRTPLLVHCTREAHPLLRLCCRCRLLAALRMRKHPYGPHLPLRPRTWPGVALTRPHLSCHRFRRLLWRRQLLAALVSPLGCLASVTGEGHARYLQLQWACPAAARLSRRASQAPSRHGVVAAAAGVVEAVAVVMPETFSTSSRHSGGGSAR